MSETTTQEPPDATFALMARLADNKFFLGRRYAEWCSSAPTLESSVAAAAMAQDELRPRARHLSRAEDARP